MKGRIPTPAAIHILQGTFRRDRHGGTAQVEVKIPKPPRDLDKRGRAQWRYFAPLLADMRTLGLADRQALACYCAAAGRREQAEEELGRLGPVVKSPSGYPIQNPWLAIANKSMEQMLKWGQELGLSPAARSRIKIEPVAPREVVSHRNRREETA